MAELKPIIEQSMIQYAGAVLQSRALVDVRDGLKPSARQIFYCMDKYKYVAAKPFNKTMAVIGDAMKHFYIHGDSSCEGIIMRAGQLFAMRYPLVEIKGNGGTLLSSGNWAAPRYTETRLSKLAAYLFADIDKKTIDDWRDNYADNEQYPSVLPTKGYYNIVNGATGIGIGMASSIPQFNIKELNKALETLLLNPNASFDEIYCAPDFATGGILLNESEIKESLKNGTGAACKLRSVVDFDKKERCFIVTEIPYAVYTNTICSELESILDDLNNPGIERFNDLTGVRPLIKIYLSKKANPDRVLKYLYKNTSLQSYYGINMTMLDNGRFPKVFTWKEALQAHIEHEKEVYKRGFEFDLEKISSRIHIIDGILICLASIEEVIQIIKKSSSVAAASVELCNKFLLDKNQAKAVLDMKLSRLAHLEVEKLQNERLNLQNEADRINNILNNGDLFNKELINGWRDVANKFGDARRTQIKDLSADDSNETIEEQQLSLSFTNKGAVYVFATSTLYSQKKNGVGLKFKLSDGEYVVDNICGKSTDVILFFTKKGNYYHLKMNEFEIGEKQYLSSLLKSVDSEEFVAAALLNKSQYILFVTQNGIVKKSELNEYNMKRNVGTTAIKLDKDDEIASVLFLNDEKIGIMSKKSHLLILDSKQIATTGRNTKGVIGIKLTNDVVIAAHLVKSSDKEIILVSEDGYAKRVKLDEFKVTGRGTKGAITQKEKSIGDFITTSSTNDVVVTSNHSQIRLKYMDIPILSRSAQGAKTLKLAENSTVIKIEQL